MSIASQIHTLLKNSGQLNRVPRTATIEQRLSDGQYLYVTSDAGAGSGLRDQDGNPVSLGQQPGNGRTVVGAIMVRKLNWYMAEVRHLVVSPDFQGQGVAAALMRMAEAKAVSLGARMLVGTERQDDESESVAEDAGFDIAAEFSNSRSGNDINVMVKVLS